MYLKLQKSVDCVMVKLPNPVRVDIKNISELLIHALGKNHHLSHGSFSKIFLKEYKKIKHLKKTKIAKSRKLFYPLYERRDEISKINERCLFKCFLSFLLKGIIWELEFRKLGTPIEPLDDKKLYHSIYKPLEFFFLFFENYNFKNSKNLLGISFSDFEKVLDKDISNDFSYYNLILKNKTCLSTKLLFSHYSLLYDDKEFISQYLQKSLKSITSSINTICNEKGFPDLDKILYERKIEKNRILCDNVDLNEITDLIGVYIARTGLRKIPTYDPDYKKAKRLIRKYFPEFVIP